MKKLQVDNSEKQRFLALIDM